MRNSTVELRTSAQALQLQASLIRDQAAETTFFRIVELHLRVLEGVTISRTTRSAGKKEIRVFNGRAAIDEMYDIFRLIYRGEKGTEHGAKLANAYDAVLRAYEPQQAPYLASVAQLFLALRSAPQRDAVRLDGIVKGLLSPTELALLLYHARFQPNSELTKLLLAASPVARLSDDWLMDPTDRSGALAVAFPPVAPDEP